MGVPKKRKSHSQSGMHRSHDALGRSYPVICPNCAEQTLRHRACPSCGQYRGKQIVAQKEAKAE